MDRFEVTFRIMAPELDPDQVMRALKLKPSESHRKGDPRPSPAGKKYSPFSEGLWSLSSGIDSSSPLQEHLDRLIDQLLPVKGALAAFHQAPHRQDIFVGVFGQNGNPGFSLRPETLQRLASLGVELCFDVYP